MNVEVYFARDPFSPAPEYEHVASVTLPPELEGAKPEAQLEFAWTWTQNVSGSWSRGQWADDARNWDWSPNVQVVKPLYAHNGVTYGHRSSMVGDVFEIAGKRYRAAPVGFEEVK